MSYMDCGASLMQSIMYIVYFSIMLALSNLERSLQEHSEKINKLQGSLKGIRENCRNPSSVNYIEVVTIILGIIISQAILHYFS